MSARTSENKLQRCNSKDELWENAGPRRDIHPVDSNFRWVTQDGTILRAQDMHTSHLYNALRMLWNHTVPRAYVVLPFNHKYKVNIDKPMRKWAVSNLFNELMNRTDLTPGMQDGLRQMAGHVVRMRTKSIKW